MAFDGIGPANAGSDITASATKRIMERFNMNTS
jgi:hypothetical protein